MEWNLLHTLTCGFQRWMLRRWMRLHHSELALIALTLDQLSEEGLRLRRQAQLDLEMRRARLRTDCPTCKQESAEINRLSRAPVATTRLAKQF
jgi:hypothetical protein